MSGNTVDPNEALIIVKVGQKGVHYAKVHFKGEVINTGKLLLEKFNTQALAERIVSLGVINQLTDDVLENYKSMTWDQAHGCSLGQASYANTIYDAIARHETFYNYVFHNGRWHLMPHCYYDTLIPLPDKIELIEA